ncbi:hypothetical protein HYPSUDRAFT_49743, partial [Hypholoma sublateritium FD-334 SS-4]
LLTRPTSRSCIGSSASSQTSPSARSSTSCASSAARTCPGWAPLLCACYRCSAVHLWAL